jgi:RimJ/RimL family protein N-acetyltransferase
MTGYSIEPVNPTEFEEFLGYLDDLLSDNGKGETPCFVALSASDTRFPPEKEAAFRNGLLVPIGSAGWRRAWAARSSNRQIIGHVDLRAHPQRFTEHRCLLGMGVHRQHRKHGLGAALIAHAESWALFNTALEWIDLQVLSGNEPAIRLYVRSGFTKVGEVPEMFKVDGQFHSDTMMSKRLVRGRKRRAAAASKSAS